MPGCLNNKSIIIREIESGNIFITICAASHSGRMEVKMNYIFHNVSEVDTKAEMVKFLNKCSLGHIVVGENAIQQNNYYIVEGYSDYDKNNCFGVAILSEGHGLKPEVLNIQEKKKLIVGANRNVYVIDYIKKEVERTFSFESLFYTFLEVEGHQMIIVIYETGAAAINYNFEVIWNFYGDIVSEYQIKGDVLKLGFFEGGTIKLSILDGARQSH